MKNITIAVDGPAGAGKSTISKKIASRLKISYIDTGAMYRAFTLKLLRNKIKLDDKKAIMDVLGDTEIDFSNNHIYLDGAIADEAIRDNLVSKNVSNVAKIKEVREALVQLQRQIASNKSVIMDGRDIGSYVIPQANFKFYITASVKERGKRRYFDLLKKDNSVRLENIIEEIKERDKIDSTRKFAPLIKCDDALEIDTTNKSIDEVVNKIIDYIEKGGH